MSKILKHINFVYYILFIFIILQFIHMISPFTMGKLKIMNEFYDIPEETLVNGKYVDNTAFINEHSILNLNNKYDVRVNKFSEIKPDEEYQVADIIDLYDRPTGYKTLTVVKSASISDNSQNSVFASSNNYLSPEEEDFLKKNQFEIHQQILNRWVIHHHNHILGPINEFALGKSLNNIFAQYGWLNIPVLKSIMEATGGISYQNYFKVFYSIYYIYYALFIGLLFLIFRRIDYVLMGAALSFAALNRIGYDSLFLGPGINPSKHFFDLFIVAFLFLYLNKGKLKYFVSALVFSLIAFLNNTQFGLFALVSLLLTLGIRHFNEVKLIVKEKILIILTGLAALCILVWVKMGQDPISLYFLAGLLGFMTSDTTFYIIFMLLSTLYAILIKFAKIQDNFKYLALFSLFYSQMMLVYYIWHSVEGYLLVFAPIYIFTVSVFLKLIINNIEFLRKRESLVVLGLIILSFGYYIPSVDKYYTSKNFFNKIFTDHKTYEWNFDRAKFISTANPKYFEDSINLLKDYSKGNSVCIISKYDNFLPFLAEKYSSMPYFDVSWYLLTKKEVTKTIETLKNAKPEYLFVDTDIDRNKLPDIVGATPDFWFHKDEKMYVHNESIWRIQRLDLLRQVFNTVRNDYVPIKKTYLLTVYKKNANYHEK